MNAHKMTEREGEPETETEKDKEKERAFSARMNIPIERIRVHRMNAHDSKMTCHGHMLAMGSCPIFLMYITSPKISYKHIMEVRMPSARERVGSGPPGSSPASVETVRALIPLLPILPISPKNSVESADDDDVVVVPATWAQGDDHPGPRRDSMMMGSCLVSLKGEMLPPIQ